MITQTTTPGNKKVQKRLKKIARKLLRVTFNNETVTHASNFQFLQTFKELIGFSEMVQTHLTLEYRYNALYTSNKLLDYLIDGICLGYTRFSHMEVFQQDPGYLLVKGDDRFPDESTFRRFLAKFKPEHLEQLTELNRKILWRKACTENVREVWIDIDDTVITLFGDQEGGETGYNPRYHGRSSLKLKVAFVAETGELVYLRLVGGKANARKDLLDFIKEIEASLPPNYILKGVRADSGFPDQEVMGYLEERQIAYVFKLPKKATIKKAILFLEHEPAFWEMLEKTKETWEKEESWAAADISLVMTNWSKSRRVVIYREPEIHLPQEKQLTLPLITYTYQAIVTNLEPDEMTPTVTTRLYS